VDQSYLDIADYQKDLGVSQLDNGDPNIIEMLYTNDDLVTYPTEGNQDEYDIYVGAWYAPSLGNTTTIPIIISKTTSDQSNCGLDDYMKLNLPK
jgi:hypothetical protein